MAMSKEKVWDYYCNECGWIGDDEELKVLMIPNENNRQDKTLYETKVCPECKENNLSK